MDVFENFDDYFHDSGSFNDSEIATIFIILTHIFTVVNTEPVEPPLVANVTILVIWTTLMILAVLMILRL